VQLEMSALVVSADMIGFTRSSYRPLDQPEIQHIMTARCLPPGSFYYDTGSTFHYLTFNCAFCNRFFSHRLSRDAKERFVP